MNAWMLHNGVTAEQLRGRLTVVPHSIDLGSSDREGVERLIAGIEAQLGGSPPSLIVIDTLQRNFGSGDENSARDMGAFIHNCDDLRTHFGAAVLVVHHTGKDKGDPRGSSALEASLDMMSRVKDVKKGQSGLVTLAFEKLKLLGTREPVRLEVLEETGPVSWCH
jgi:hypothetical protein